MTTPTHPVSDAPGAGVTRNPGTGFEKQDTYIDGLCDDGSIWRWRKRTTEWRLLAVVPGSRAAAALAADGALDGHPLQPRE